MSTSISSLTPYFIVKNARVAIDFYGRAFGAEELFRMTDPRDGRIGHAELKIGESTVMIADEYPDFGALSPDTIGGSPVTFHLATLAVDADLARAVDAGAVVCVPLQIKAMGSASPWSSILSAIGGCFRRGSRMWRRKRCSAAGTSRPEREPGRRKSNRTSRHGSLGEQRRRGQSVAPPSRHHPLQPGDGRHYGLGLLIGVFLLHRPR